MQPPHFFCCLFFFAYQISLIGFQIMPIVNPSPLGV